MSKWIPSKWCLPPMMLVAGLSFAFAQEDTAGKDCGASGLGCRTDAEIAWVNKASEIFPNGTGMAHRAFGYYCARNPAEQATCLGNPWAIVAKLKMDRSDFDQSQ